jgi:drug/metabolite transporter (DMT)-like permease
LAPTPTISIRAGKPYLLLGLLLLCDVTAFLFEKVATVRADGQGWAFLVALLHQPLFWSSLALGPIQLVLWTRILSRLDLSKAYPITGLNMPLTLIAATVILGERLSWQVWVGASLITLGGAIIGPGAGKTQQMPVTPPG